MQWSGHSSRYHNHRIGWDRQAKIFRQGSEKDKGVAVLAKDVDHRITRVLPSIQIADWGECPTFGGSKWIRGAGQPFG